MPLCFIAKLFFETDVLKKNKIRFSLLLGIIFSVAYVLIDGLFFTLVRYPQYGILSNWIYYLINMSLIPWACKLYCFGNS